MTKPVAGRVVRFMAERLRFYKEGGKFPRGHFGQVIPIEDAKAILAITDPINKGQGAYAGRCREGLPTINAYC